MKMIIVTVGGEKMVKEIKSLSKLKLKDMRDAMIGCGTDHYETGEYVEIANVLYVD